MKYYFVIAFISTLLFLMEVQCAFAQQQKPEWTNGFFEESSISYLEVVSGMGYEVADARKKAVNQIIERRSLATGSDNKVIINGNDVRVERSHDLIVKSRIIDEYHERIGTGQYKVYLLVQTVKNPTYSFDNVRITDHYPLSPRVFVPGMAQIYKGSTAKGVSFIVGELVFAGGIILGESFRISNVNLINSTHNESLRYTYTQKANNWALVRNVSIAGAVAVYVWNVIDGIVAKGDKTVLLGSAKINASPYIDSDNFGLALNINF